MTGMEPLLIGAAIGGTVLQASGEAFAGEQAAKAAEFNARVLEQQAKAEQDAAAAEASDFKRQEGRKTAMARASRGATGVTDAGSPLMVDEATVREIALGAARIGHGGMVRSQRTRDEATLKRFRGQNERAAGYIKAGTSILNGIGSFAGA